MGTQKKGTRGPDLYPIPIRGGQKEGRGNLRKKHGRGRGKRQGEHRVCNGRDRGEVVVVDAESGARGLGLVLGLWLGIVCHGVAQKVVPAETLVAAQGSSDGAVKLMPNTD